VLGQDRLGAVCKGIFMLDVCLLRHVQLRRLSAYEAA